MSAAHKEVFGIQPLMAKCFRFSIFLRVLPGKTAPISVQMRQSRAMCLVSLMIVRDPLELEALRLIRANRGHVGYEISVSSSEEDDEPRLGADSPEPVRKARHGPRGPYAKRTEAGASKGNRKKLQKHRELVLKGKLSKIAAVVPFSSRRSTEKKSDPSCIQSKHNKRFRIIHFGFLQREAFT